MIVFRASEYYTKKQQEKKDATDWGSAWMGLKTLFPLQPISQGFLQPCYYLDSFERIGLIARLLSELAFLVQSQDESPLKQSRFLHLPGSLRAPLAL